MLETRSLKFNSLPSFPAVSLARWKLLRYLKFSAMPHVTLAVSMFERYHLISSSASFMFSATGFSDSTCLPAESAVLMYSGCFKMGSLRDEHKYNKIYTNLTRL